MDSIRSGFSYAVYFNALSGKYQSLVPRAVRDFRLPCRHGWCKWFIDGWMYSLGVPCLVSCAL